MARQFSRGSDHPVASNRVVCVGCHFVPFFALTAFILCLLINWLSFFFQSCNLSRLNLAETSVQYHEDAIRENFKNLRGIWIFDNPWHCNCHLRNVIDISISYEELTNNVTLIEPCTIRNSSLGDDILFVDEKEYFYDGECQIVAWTEQAKCFPFTVREKYFLHNVSRSYLRCPDEPIVLFIAIIIGPISLLAAILIIFLCG